MIEIFQKFLNEAEALELLGENEVLVVVKSKNGKGLFAYAYPLSRNMEGRIRKLELGANVLYGDHEDKEIKRLQK